MKQIFLVTEYYDGDSGIGASVEVFLDKKEALAFIKQQWNDMKKNEDIDTDNEYYTITPELVDVYVEDTGLYYKIELTEVTSRTSITIKD